MFEFNREDQEICPACGTVHEAEDDSFTGVEVMDFDSEKFVEDMVAMFAEHVTTEDELRAGLKRVFLTGFMNGIQSCLIESIQSQLEELNEAQSMLFGDK